MKGETEAHDRREGGGLLPALPPAVPQAVSVPGGDDPAVPAAPTARVR